MGIFGESKAVIYQTVDQVDLSSNSDEVYIRPDVKAPRMTGFVVKLFAWILECRILGAFLAHMLQKANSFHKFISRPDLVEPPVYVPFNTYQDLGEKEVKSVESDLTASLRVQEALDCIPLSLELEDAILDATKRPSSSSFHRWTILDYAKAYKSGKATPLMVVERFIAAVDKSSIPSNNMGFFINCNVQDILRQATESTSRYQRGEPLSVLDGVPVAVKDEIDCTPYPTTGGTKWLHRFRPCPDDAVCVEHLRSCGALLVGKTNMHELGAGTSGINPHYGASRNPYNIHRISGGSSGGSAAVVCAGLCPVALGVDGGGSVRLPAALCGVIGFKPTTGRFSHAGVVPLNWTVGSVGVLAGSIEDALIVYAAMSGSIPTDGRNLLLTPRLNLPLLKPANFTHKIKLVKYGEWFNDCSEDIRLCCSRALDKLRKKYGWETVEMTIPEIEVMRLAHYLTLGSECATFLDPFLEKLDYDELGGDTRVALSLYGSFHSKDYIKAQRVRNRQMQFHRRIFSQADFIVTPTTGVTAYELKDDALVAGELDYVNGAALVKFVIAGNFLGLPAVSVPVGYDNNGLPIGLQFIGKPWSEATLFRLAFAMQALCISEYKKPDVFYNLIG